MYKCPSSRIARAHTGQKEDTKPKDDQPVKLTKAQRKAQHAELNRKIWESACVKRPFTHSR
jgi:hypothetical protein